MKTLIILDQATKILELYSSTLAPSVPFPSTVQVIPACDAGPDEWAWADWVVLGFSRPAGSRPVPLEQFLAGLPASLLSGKGFSIFQIQMRTDPPISGAYGYGLARRLKQRGMVLLAPPIVFFRTESKSETEGELLRSTLWLDSMVKRLLRLSPEDEK